MALGGRETVGTAYVRILADGSGLGRSIKREMDDVEPDISKAGEEHSRAYQEGFNAEQKRNKTMEKGLVAKFDRAFGQIESRAATMSRDLEGKIKRNIEKGVRDLDPDVAEEVGRRVAKNMADGFAKSGRLSSNISGEIDRALNEINQEQIAFERNWRASFNRINADTDRITASIAANLHHVEGSFEDIRVAASRASDDRSRRGMALMDKDMGRFAKTVSDRLGKAGHHIDIFAGKYGKAFGAGSRNNFVNFFGEFITLPIRALSGITKLGQKIADFALNTSTAFTEAGGGLQGFVKVAGTSLLKAGGAILGILGGIVFIAGPVAGAISGIAGALTALASSLSFALIGGLGAVAGLLPVIAAGASVLGLAFIGMSDDAKKALSESIKPIKTELQDLQQVAQKGIFKGLADAAPDIAGVFRKAKPLIKDVGDAIGDVITDFADAANSKGFKDFIATMQTFIPDAIRTLGRVARHTLGGLGGIFEGLIPISKRFLGWLDRLTTKFDKWANSAEGKKSIKDFMDDAATSASDLWDLLTKVGEALGLLLFDKKGKKAGDSIIKDMTAAVQDFIDWLNANPGALDKWFADGLATARKIGGAIRRLSKLFEELDTPRNRHLANDILGTINRALDIMVASAGFAAEAWRGIKGAWNLLPFSSVVENIFKVVGAVDDMKESAGGMKEAFRNALADMVNRFLDTVGSIVHGAASAFGWVPGLGPKLKAAARKFDEFKTTVNDSIRGIDDVVVGVKISGGQAAIEEIATLRYELQHIPKSVTTTVLAKVQHIPLTASGGVFGSPQMRMIGEAGPEAVVPLNRPLSQVDPAVRALSAVAQGKTTTVTTNNAGRTIEVGGLTIVTPTKDPAAVARETVNQLVASSYF